MARRRPDRKPDPASDGLAWARAWIADDWIDEGDVPPSHWQGTIDEFRAIRSHQRWLVARMRWSAEHAQCIRAALGEVHQACNLCWIADGRMKPPELEQR